MKTVCAWCGKHLEGPEDAAEVSHGICKECLAHEMAEVAMEEEESDVLPMFSM